MRMPRLLLILLFLSTSLIAADPATIHVFVALADNKSQGIIPVPAKIGNGDDPEHNLYWGCDEALPAVFRASKAWKLEKTEAGPKPEVLERKTYRHESGQWRVVADAYRGSAIRMCTTDFFAALASEEPVAASPLAIYVGHDGLMDFALPEAATAQRGPGREAIVLCCQSAGFFGPHLTQVNARPVLLTQQLMYPGGFLVLAALDGWTKREAPASILQRAAAAYARNQKISTKAAAGVFTTGMEK